jgi:hypothetical protein
VLDFDTRSPRAADEVNQIVQNVWSRYPVMLFTKVSHFFGFLCSSLMLMIISRPSFTMQILGK